MNKSVPVVTDSRDRAVLRASVEEYIESGEPVASRTLNRKALPLSAALIRSIMARLETRGLLFQPHVSAGRVPTHQGYRVYVDQLMTQSPLEQHLKRRIDSFFAAHGVESGGVLDSAASAIADVSGMMGFAVRAPLGDAIHRHIEFVRLESRRVLAIVATRSGVVYHRCVNLESDVSAAELIRFQNYLNARFEGLSLCEIRQIVAQELAEITSQYVTLQMRALALSEQVLPPLLDEKPQVTIGGQHHLLRFAEFSSNEKAHRLFQELECRETWIQVLDATLSERDVKITIGAENLIDGFSTCSVVAGSICRSDGLKGTIGLVGPTRLKYRTALAVLNWVRRHVDSDEELSN